MKLTIADIAKIANVSKATVSRVLNNRPEGVGKETREKILKIIEENDFQPSMLARGLVTKKTRSLGLIIPDITNPFFPQLVRGAEDYANKHGYNLFLCNSDKSIEKEKEYIHAFIEKSVDGVILTSNMPEMGGHHEILKVNHIPVVLLDRHIEGTGYDAGVFLDNTKGAYMAVRHLVDNDHKAIVLITGPLTVMTSKHRLMGYETALAEKGLKVDYDLIKEGDYLMKSGYDIIDQLLDEGKKFTAVFAANDMMAIGAIKALKNRSIKIPEDVEVIGFDNIEISQIVEPSLSTVAQPAYEMGSMGAKLLISLIKGEKLKKKKIMLEPKFILRDSTRNKG